MSVYALKDRTVKMYIYNSEIDKTLSSRSTSTVSDFVGKFLPSVSTQQQIRTILPNNADIITLSAVQKIEISYKAGIAIEQGLTVSFIQPWYIEPATIKLNGTSYLGCYPDISPNDTDVEDIYGFFNDRLAPTSLVKKWVPNTTGTVGAQSQQMVAVVGDKKEIVLEIINNPKKTDRFIGYITSFNFSENIDKPFLLDYDIEFVGKPDSRRLQEEAKKTSFDDLTKVRGI